MVCCVETISKTVIIALNIVFMVLGLAIMVPGILMFTNIDFLSDEITPLLDKISFNGVNLGSISNNLPMLFIIIGGVILAIAAIGLIGACCKIKTLLVVYAIILIVLLIAQIIILAFFFLLRSMLDDTIKQEFLNQLQNSYKQDALDKSDEVSSSFNYMFMQMECCGIDPVTSTSNDFDNTPWGRGTAQRIPKGCCKDVTENNYASYSNAACTDTATSGQYWSEGCFDKIMNSFGATLDAMGYVCLIAVLVQVLLVVFAFCLCCSYATDIV